MKIYYEKVLKEEKHCSAFAKLQKWGWRPEADG